MNDDSAICPDRGESQPGTAATFLAAESQPVEVPVTNYLISDWAWNFGELVFFFFTDPLFEATMPVSVNRLAAAWHCTKFTQRITAKNAELAQSIASASAPLFPSGDLSKTPLLRSRRHLFPELT